jgi:hypothetical protein
MKRYSLSSDSVKTIAGWVADPVGSKIDDSNEDKLIGSLLQQNVLAIEGTPKKRKSEGLKPNQEKFLKLVQVHEGLKVVLYSDLNKGKWDKAGGQTTGLSYQEASNAYSQLIEAKVLIKNDSVFAKGLLVDLD